MGKKDLQRVPRYVQNYNLLNYGLDLQLIVSKNNEINSDGMVEEDIMVTLRAFSPYMDSIDPKNKFIVREFILEPPFDNDSYIYTHALKGGAERIVRSRRMQRLSEDEFLQYTYFDKAFMIKDLNINSLLDDIKGLWNLNHHLWNLNHQSQRPMVSAVSEGLQKFEDVANIQSTRVGHGGGALIWDPDKILIWHPDKIIIPQGGSDRSIDNRVGYGLNIKFYNEHGAGEERAGGWALQPGWHGTYHSAIINDDLIVLTNPLTNKTLLIINDGNSKYCVVISFFEKNIVVEGVYEMSYDPTQNPPDDFMEQDSTGLDMESTIPFIIDKSFEMIEPGFTETTPNNSSFNIKDGTIIGIRQHSSPPENITQIYKTYVNAFLNKSGLDFTDYSLETSLPKQGGIMLTVDKGEPNAFLFDNRLTDNPMVIPDVETYAPASDVAIFSFEHEDSEEIVKIEIPVLDDLFANGIANGIIFVKVTNKQNATIEKMAMPVEMQSLEELTEDQQRTWLEDTSGLSGLQSEVSILQNDLQNSLLILNDAFNRVEDQAKITQYLIKQGLQPEQLIQNMVPGYQLTDDETDEEISNILVDLYECIKNTNCDTEDEQLNEIFNSSEFNNVYRPDMLSTQLMEVSKIPIPEAPVVPDPEDKMRGAYFPTLAAGPAPKAEKITTISSGESGMESMPTESPKISFTLNESWPHTDHWSNENLLKTWKGSKLNPGTHEYYDCESNNKKICDLFHPETNPVSFFFFL